MAQTTLNVLRKNCWRSKVCKYDEKSLRACYSWRFLDENRIVQAELYFNVDHVVNGRRYYFHDTVLFINNLLIYF